MEIMTTTAVYHNTEMYLSGGNGSFREGYKEYDAELQKSLKIVYLIIFSLVFVLGALGNGVVIWATGFKMLKNVNTIWYLNLAVADFLVIAFLPLRMTYTALDGHWPFGKFMCKMNTTVFFTSMYASIYTLTVISVDRCVCVVCPVWAQNHRSVRKASRVILGVWVLALALSSPYFVFRDTRPSKRGKDLISCYNNFAPTGSYEVMLTTRFLMGFVIPFTVIVSCYSVIIYWLRNKHSLAGQSRRPFKIIATVITTFFLCWVPYHIIDQITLTLKHVANIGFPIAVCIALINSCLNPLLYVFMGQEFKDVFRRSILKVLEKAFAEELPQTNTYTNPQSTSQEAVLSEAQV